jgi:DNA-directed RNA polymerase subunit K/omega
MTLDKLIYDIKEGVNQFTDDSEISDKYIIYLLEIKRAKYLRQGLNNLQKTYDNSITQTFCVGLEEVSKDECGINVDCDTILKTTVPIPVPLDLDTGVAIQSVKPTDRLATNFNFITKKRAQFISGARFNKAIYSFLDADGFIYVISGPNNNHYKLLECLTITGVFADPLALSEFVSCCGCTSPASCFNPATTEYPLQPRYIDLIRDEIIKTLVIKLQIPEDKSNDSDNEIINGKSS